MHIRRTTSVTKKVRIELGTEQIEELIRWALIARGELPEEAQPDFDWDVGMDVRGLTIRHQTTTEEDEE